MLKLAIILLATLAFYNINARTCICAQFTDMECNEQEHCQWHHISISYGAIKGNHGICRSNQWMECHADPNCVIPGNNPQNVGYDDNNNDNPRRLQENTANNGYDAVNSMDTDWPWDCLNGDYREQVINVRPFQLLAKPSPLELLYNGKPSTVSTVHSSSMIAKVIGLITFIIGVLIGIAVCWKSKNNEKQFELIQPLNAGASYSTF